MHVPKAYRGRGTRGTNCGRQRQHSRRLRERGGGTQRRRRAAWGTEVRGPEARASSGWLNMKEAGMDDVGEQVTGARTTLTITNCVENFHVSSGKVFSSITRGLLLNFSFLRENFHGNFSSAESPRNAYTLLFREKSSRISRHRFLSFFARRVFGRTVRADCLSSRHVRAIWRGGAGARSVVFGPK
jgi:hypothetical protein